MDENSVSRERMYLFQQAMATKEQDCQISAVKKSFSSPFGMREGERRFG